LLTSNHPMLSNSNYRNQLKFIPLLTYLIFDLTDNHKFLNKAPEPLPVEIEGEFEYKVEQILDSQLYRENLQYLVKWLGYTKEYNTWELVNNLTNSQEAVDDFHCAYPSAPHHI
jgi:Chromo (CHRromatin Organisation MOdifier) domain